MDLIFEKSVPNRRGFSLPESDVPVKGDLPIEYKRAEECGLPELTELEVVRHFTKLSQLNFCIDTNFYKWIVSNITTTPPPNFQKT